MNECACGECSKRREDAARLRSLKATLPEPEYDWADLEARDRRSRVDPGWYRRRTG